jgi:hypothetical protein
MGEMTTRTRPHTRAFTADAGTGKNYLLDGVPAALWSTVRAKAKRDGVSVRAVILHLLTQWIAGDVTLPATEDRS